MAGYHRLHLRTRSFVLYMALSLSLSLRLLSLSLSLFRASLVYPSSPAPHLEFCFVFPTLLVGFGERSCGREGFFFLSKWWQVRSQRRHVWRHGLHRKRWWRGAPHAPAPAPRMRRRPCLLRRISIIRGSRVY